MFQILLSDSNIEILVFMIYLVMDAFLVFLPFLNLLWFHAYSLLLSRLTQGSIQPWLKHTELPSTGRQQ